MFPRLLLALLGLLVAAWLAPSSARATSPAEVVVGTYINKIQDLNFREDRYTLDFFIWYRWKAEGALADYKPLDSLELVNGRIEDRSSIVEKQIGDQRYASMRVRATMSNTWNLAAFPFDWHEVEVRIEDSLHPAQELVFVADRPNSGLGEEIDMAGWRVSHFDIAVQPRIYRTNYGDTSLPTGNESEYSRLVMTWDLDRTGWGAAVKLLSTVFLAVGVAFVSFMVKPSDLDARFGMGVGGLFAAAASAFVVASAVPDSGSMTLADQVHMVALAFIFVTLLVSAFCLRLEVAGREDWAFRIDHWCLALLPPAYFGWAIWAIRGTFH